MPIKLDIINSVKNYNKGSLRSIQAKKNIIAGAFIRFFSIGITFLLIPVTIDYVNPQIYGIWLTLSSVIAWTSLFDIGISNGLRNKLAAAFALNSISKARSLISTAFAYLTLIFIPLLIVLNVINVFIDWNDLLNISREIAPNLRLIFSIIIIYFCLNFILSTVNIVLLADQRIAEASLRSLIIQILSLLIIFILTKTTQGSLLILTVTLCSVPLITQIIFNLTLFSKRYKLIRPSLKSINFKYGKEIITLGFQFFIIQISGIILFQSANFIIMRYFGPNDVTAYNISYKYFSIMGIGISIFVSPLWSAVTDAYTKNDLTWIKRAVNKFLVISLLITLIGLILLLFSNYLYRIWVGDSIKISTELSTSLFIFNVVSVFGGVFVNVLNGMGKLKNQFYASVASPLIFLILIYLFMKVLHLGVYSIVLAVIISNFNAFLVAPIEYYYFIKKHVQTNSES